MKSPISAEPNRAFELSIFLARVGDAWRIHVWPGWLPAFLRGYFDEEGEAYPVYLDLEELERKMQSSGVTYQARETSIGGIELAATGASATVMAHWLAQSFNSGRRDVADSGSGEGSSSPGMAG